MRANLSASVPHSAMPSGKSFCKAVKADSFSESFILDSFIFSDNFSRLHPLTLFHFYKKLDKFFFMLS